MRGAAGRGIGVLRFPGCVSGGGDDLPEMTERRGDGGGQAAGGRRHELARRDWTAGGRGSMHGLGEEARAWRRR